MGTLAIHVGSAVGGTLRALVLSKDEQAAPVIAVTDRATGHAAQVTTTEHTRPALRQALTARGVKARKVVATGLTPGREALLTATAFGAPAITRRVKMLPAKLPAEGLTLAVASCFFRGFPAYRKLADALRTRRLIGAAELLVLAGDNLYMDVLDPGGFTGGDPQEVVTRYLQYLFDPDVADARSVVPSIATWDDHEYWNDYPEEQKWLPFTRHSDGRRKPFEAMAKDCVDAFAAELNPPGPSRSFQFRLDGPTPSQRGLDFFVADARGERSEHGAQHPRLMPQDSFDELIAWAGNLDRPGVLVIGQPLWIPATFQELLGLITADHNPPAFRTQYRAIMEAIRTAAWDILVVSGDVHYSRLLRVTLGGSAGERSFFELVSSPLVHIPGAAAVLTGGHFGLPQGTSSVGDPSKVPELPGAKATYLAGTGAPNTFALARFTPTAAGVRVGVSFEDLAGTGRAAITASTNNGAALPGVATATEGCTFRLSLR